MPGQPYRTRALMLQLINSRLHRWREFIKGALKALVDSAARPDLNLDNIDVRNHVPPIHCFQTKQSVGTDKPLEPRPAECHNDVVASVYDYGLRYLGDDKLNPV